MRINLKHKNSGAVRQTKLGFSWTKLLFGCLPALFRGDFKFFLIMLLTTPIGPIIFAFIYNKLYIKNLLEKGYHHADDMSRNALVQKGIILNAA